MKTLRMIVESVIILSAFLCVVLLSGCGETVPAKAPLNIEQTACVGGERADIAAKMLACKGDVSGDCATRKIYESHEAAENKCIETFEPETEE